MNVVQVHHIKLPAQGQWIGVIFPICFVLLVTWVYRLYYRNDPDKYGLSWKIQNSKKIAVRNREKNCGSGTYGRA